MKRECPHNPVTRGMLAVVVGTGASGQAAAKLLHELGARVRVVDRNEKNVPKSFSTIIDEYGFEVAYGEHSSEQFAGAELVVPSPGVAVRKLLPYLPDMCKVLAEIELAWRCLDIPTLAVTGTNGKTTTVSLCARMLEEAGKKVFLGGNIGTPLSDFVLRDEAADVLVLELSSFQLQTTESFRPQVGVLLNISPDHLDYHENMEEYQQAKMRLFANQECSDMAILGEDIARRVSSFAGNAQKQIFSATNRFPHASLQGIHNRANMEAAWLACQPFGVDMAAAERAVANFSAAPHTLQHVDIVRGVHCINDSKATTVESLRAALESFDTPVLLLAGGVYKGGDLASLIPLLREKVRAVGLYGGNREIFEMAWKGSIPLCWQQSMELAVQGLMEKAQEGDVLLLSPATSSFDQYASYKARGNDFIRIVEALV